MNSIKYLTASLFLQQSQANLNTEQLFAQIESDQSLSFDDAKAPASHPIVQFRNMFGQTFDEAKDIIDFGTLDREELDSFNLFKGFIDESVSLDPRKKELEKDANYHMDELATHFKGLQNLIYRPVERVFWIQSHDLMDRRSENQKEYKILNALCLVMTETPERMIHVNEMSKEAMRFVIEKAWPLCMVDVLDLNPDIQEHYEAMSDAYREEDWETMGHELAIIADIMHDEEIDKRGWDAVMAKDKKERESDHKWYDTIED